MVRHFIIIFLCSIICLVFIFNNVFADSKAQQWERASKTMVRALKTDNDGLKISVLHNIIRYGDKLDVGDAVFDIMRIYRNHKDERVRQLALIALHKIENDWAMNFLKRALKFENSPILRKRIYAILFDYYQQQGEVESLFALSMKK